MKTEEIVHAQSLSHLNLAKFLENGTGFFQTGECWTPTFKWKGCYEISSSVSSSLEDRSVGLIGFFLKLQMKLGVLTCKSWIFEGNFFF